MTPRIVDNVWPRGEASRSSVRKETIINAPERKQDAHLKRRSLQIDDLAATTPEVRARARIEDLVYVAELMALHAIAQSKFDEFRGARASQRARLATEMNLAWNDLETAFGRPRP